MILTECALLNGDGYGRGITNSHGDGSGSGAIYRYGGVFKRDLADGYGFGHNNHYDGEGIGYGDGFSSGCGNGYGIFDYFIDNKGRVHKGETMEQMATKKLAKKQRIINDIKTTAQLFVFLFAFIWMITGCTAFDKSAPATKLDIKELELKLEEIQTELAYISDQMEAEECEYQEQEV